MPVHVSQMRLEALLPRLQHAVYPQKRPLSVSVWECPGEPVPFEEARQQQYRPFAVGSAWGHRWATSWFHLVGVIPDEWQDQMVVACVDFGFEGIEGFMAEALVFKDGLPSGALNVNRREIPVSAQAAGSERIEFYLEGAANPRINQPDLPACRDATLLPDPGGPPLVRLTQADLCVRDEAAYQFSIAFESALDLAQVLPTDSPRRRRILRELTRAANTWELDGENPEKAALIVANVLQFPAAPTHVAIHAIGHAHIDTAWLWPLRETIRKCARTFSTQLALMERYPDFHFSCSQPVHYLWMRAFYPSIWDGIRHRVATGQWEPIGSMWVEPDCNLAGGEALLRQILHGKRFFQDAFSIETKDLWLPDVFGYAASLPQLLKHCGIEYFFTQKISWNQVNTFPHHSFLWEGIDGTRLLTHFAPANTYNGRACAAEIRMSERAYLQNDVSDDALYPFGFGDGGGGPTSEHIEKLRLFRNCEGLPPVRLGRVDQFFQDLSACRDNLPVWVGELYLELHRGTYTTQARLKKFNRQNEFRLRQMECLLAHLHLHPEAREKAADFLRTQEVPPRAVYDVFALDVDDPLRASAHRAWQLLLLNQFHDILPGSSIHWVYEDAHRDHEVITRLAENVESAARHALLPDGNGADHPVRYFIANPFGRVREEWIRLPDGTKGFARVPATGWRILRAEDLRVESRDPVSLATSETGAVLENRALRVSIDKGGRLTSLWDRRAGRELLGAPAGNTFFLAVDRPPFWDAWEVEADADDMTVPIEGPASVWEILESGPLAAAIRFELRTGHSVIRQTIILTAESDRIEFHTEVDWQESHRLLRVGFPLALHHPSAHYEIQWGHVARPIERNTSWDHARFEVCAHKWVDFSEPGFGVALLNDGKYGHSVRDGWLRQSLLRSPIWPDGKADRGRHHFRYALMPHAGSFREAGVIDAAYAFNAPLQATAIGSRQGPSEASIFEVDTPALVLEALKPAEDGNGLVVRLYESWGSRGVGSLRWKRKPSRVCRIDGLEDPAGADLEVDSAQCSRFPYRPFEILSLRVCFE